MSSPPRPPCVAGRFYPADAATCRQMVDEFVSGFDVPAADCAVVPHAGWVYSGATAARSWKAIAADPPDTVVIFGATHTRDESAASLWLEGGWETPLGIAAVDDVFGQRVSACPDVAVNPEAHLGEHAIEVQIPFIQHLLPDARIVPISVRPAGSAPRVGAACARLAKEYPARVAFVASSDLTHYGPAFGYEPQGRGLEGVRWARDVNDRRMVDRIAALDAEGVLAEAAIHHNACGGGALAALIAAARVLGAVHYIELQHTCSADVPGMQEAHPTNAVGYEAGIFVA